ncbi:polyketide cyclase [Nocardioides sp. dk4132]|uniref:SRPBCC family protein n=1 Tax=unclassified Nocardioides TaxID=2615069 RepID=UPI0012970FBA|nr:MULTISPECIES: SRPBCC family protein [unclassified Nocardioides]MQW75917.1 polyketide cyclase [Nocardioides sp. dk4132]QGA08778.1 polyketide cyclase [Nocardioides sp. dk884]
MRATYSFGDSWRVAASPERVRDVVVDLERYPLWWPQVVAVASLGPDDARVLCRSVLPYTLDLVLHAVTRELPVLEVEVSGDLAGSVRFTVTEEGTGARLDFAQDVVVVGALAVASRVARPLLTWNHEQMMRGCRPGLAQRLAQHAPETH